MALTRKAAAKVLGAVVVIALLLFFSLKTDSNSSEHFFAHTDSQAAHYCLDLGYRYFVRDRASMAYCTHDAGRNDSATDAQQWIDRQMEGQE